jgi:hypothetical protein
MEETPTREKLVGKLDRVKRWKKKGSFLVLYKHVSLHRLL